MRHPARSIITLIAMLGLLPMASYAVDAETYDSVHQDHPLISTSSEDNIHDRVVSGTSSPETNGMHGTASSISDAHKKQVPAPNAPNNVSAVDLDSSTTTSGAPLGGTSKMEVGNGVLARMPGAQGR